MTFRSGARALETTTTTGTGAITLAGAITGYRTIATVASVDGDTFYYVIAGGAEWEEGLGTRTSATTFARTTPLAGSAATPVNFSAGTKEVWIDYPGRLAEARGVFTNDLTGLAINMGSIGSPDISNNNITIATGAAADSTNVDLMRLGTAITKQTNVAWAVGTNSGSLDTGAIGNSPYHVHLIKRIDTGVVDVLTSLSATAPTMPANYTLRRRIGSFTRTAGTNDAYFQSGDTFWLKTVSTWKTSLTDVAYSLVTLSGIPTNINVKPILEFQAGGNAVVFNAFASDPLDTGGTNFYAIQNIASGADVINEAHSDTIPFYTNLSAQIRMAITGATTLDFLTYSTNGWIDDRGKLGGI